MCNEIIHKLFKFGFNAFFKGVYTEIHCVFIQIFKEQRIIAKIKPFLNLFTGYMQQLKHFS